MAINLDKHRESLVAAWKDVLDEKSDTNWALFGYEGPSNDLKFVSKGDGGLTELIDDLNSGKIMYAFLKVDLPDNSISKYVLINWQGEGAPTVRKGTCANHIQHVARLFPGHHLSVHARAEDDLDARALLARLSGAGGVRRGAGGAGEGEGPRAPVGTAYRKVNPVAEINSRERDQFWRREEREESSRVAAERTRREEEKRSSEEAARARGARGGAAAWRDEAAADAGAPPRSEEARALIGRSAAAARAVFEPARGPPNNTRPCGVVPEKPARSSVIAQRINTFQNSPRDTADAAEKAALTHGNKDQLKASPLKNIDKIKMSLESPSQIQHEPLIDAGSLSPGDGEEKSFSAVTYAPKGFRDIQPPEPQQSVALLKQNILEDDVFAACDHDDDDDSDTKYSTIKRSPHSAVARQDTVVESPRFKNGGGDDASPESLEEDGAVYEDLDRDPGLTARALYDYQAADESEITFDPGDVITHIEQVDAGWWQGLGPAGAFGLFPANYVELLPCTPR